MRARQQQCVRPLDPDCLTPPSICVTIPIPFSNHRPSSPTNGLAAAASTLEICITGKSSNTALAMFAVAAIVVD